MRAPTLTTKRTTLQTSERKALTVGSLFAGIGGFDLGLERAGMKVIWQSEIDPYASAVLKKHWPHVPNHGDIRGIRRGAVEPVELICGGFPCQPFSHAGKRAGKNDDRHLWPEMCRVIDEIRPAWVVGENVPGIIGMELDATLSDLESLGYATRTFVIPAVAVDAPHRRDRVWIIARDARRLDANGDGRHVEQESEIRARWPAAAAVRDRDRDRESACAVDDETQGMPSDLADASLVMLNGSGNARATGRRESANGSCFMADSDEPRSQGRIGESVRERAGECAARTSSACAADADSEPMGRPTESRQEHCEWEPEPDVGRVANGVPSRVDRLRCLGNAIVPQIAEIIGRAIIETDEDSVHR